MSHAASLSLRPARRFWGWGWRHEQLTPAEVQAVHSMVGMLGGGSAAPLPEPRESEFDLPAPRIAAPAALASFFSASPYDRLTHCGGKGCADVLRLWARQAPHAPDWVAFARDERVLYLAVTRGNQVWRVPLLDDGSVSKVGAFFTSYGPSGPDGLAVDEAGRVIVANPGLGLAWVLNHRAEPEMVLRSCAGTSLTNVAFGGTDRKTLYCTESVTGSVLRATLERAGLPIHRPPG